MRKFDKKSLKGTWVKFPEDEEVQLLLKPFSLFNLTKLPNEQSLDFDKVWDIFNYCVLGWKGIVDSDGKEIPCDEKNKKMVFDYDGDILTFVLDQSGVLREGMVTAKEIKNLQTSQPGETQKKEK